MGGKACGIFNGRNSLTLDNIIKVRDEEVNFCTILMHHIRFICFSSENSVIICKIFTFVYIILPILRAAAYKSYYGYGYYLLPTFHVII